MSHHKGIGIGAFDRNRLTSAQYASHGNTLRTTNAAALETQLSVFRSLLHQFATTHSKEIRSNPTFRAEFARMCSVIGVDPLAGSSSSSSSGGSIWAQFLGRSVNDFYYGLAVKVVEICSETRAENGGLIGLTEVKDRITAARVEGASEVSEDDLLKAVVALKPLGSAYNVLKVGDKEYIRSVPKELSTDQTAVMEASQVEGFVSVEMLTVNLSWPEARAQTAINDLMSGGMLWVDKQSQPWEYWNPSWMVHGSDAVL